MRGYFHLEELDFSHMDDDVGINVAGLQHIGTNIMDIMLQMRWGLLHRPGHGLHFDGDGEGFLIKLML